MSKVKSNAGHAAAKQIEQAAKEQIFGANSVMTAAHAADPMPELADAPPHSEDIKDFTGRTQRNLEAATGSGMMFFQLFAATSQMWLRVGRKLGERNLDALTQMNGAKSLQQLTQIQHEAVRGGWEDFASEFRSLTASRSEPAMNDRG